MNSAPTSTATTPPLVRTDRWRGRLHDAWLSAAAHPVPWLTATVARRIGPVARVPGIGLIINDAAIGTEILRRDDRYLKNGPRSLTAQFTQVLGPRALLNMDGADHRALRRQLADLICPASATDLVDSVCHRTLDDLRSTLHSGKPVDLVHLMRTVAGRVMVEWMGVDSHRVSDAECRRLVTLSETLSAHLRVTLRPLSGRQVRVATNLVDDLVSLARAAWEQDRARPHSIVHRLRELGSSFHEVKGLLGTFFLAGTQTTSVALPRIVALLIDHDVFAKLRADPNVVPSAVDEALRLIAPLPATVRIAAVDDTIDGCFIPRHTRVILFTRNMMRDAKVFPNPDRFDITRQPELRFRHLPFGHGPHFCLGFELAKREMYAVLDTLLKVRGTPTIMRRRTARGVLLPSYRELVVRVT